MLTKPTKPSTSGAPRHRLGKLWRACGGSIAVEGAFAIAIILAMLVPMIDFAQWISLRMTLKQAVRSGGQYALHDHQYETNSSGATYGTNSLPAATVTAIENVVISAAGLTVPPDVDVPALSCYCARAPDTARECPGHTSYVACLDLVGTPGQDESGVPAVYVTITASATFNPFWPQVPWFSAGMTVVERLVMRVN